MIISKDTKILTNEDLEWFRRANVHILRRLKRVTVTLVPGLHEWVPKSSGGFKLKSTPDKYQISAVGGYHPNAVSRNNIVHEDRPFCQICDVEFIPGDRVYTSKTKVTGSHEISR